MRENFLVNGAKCELCIDGSGISWTSAGQDDRRQVQFDQVIGVRKSNNNNQTTCKKIKIYYARQTARLLTLKRLCIKSIPLSPSHLTPSDTLGRLAEQLELALDKLRKDRPARLLIFVNPFGGKGKALHLYKSQVRRLLALANINSKLVVTKYANHARDTIEDPQFNAANYDGIICIGGDGMFSEIMNGLLFRYNRDKIQATGGDCSSNATIAAVADSCADSSLDSRQQEDDSHCGFQRDNNQQDTSDKQQHDFHPAPSRLKHYDDLLAELKQAFGGIGRQFVSPRIPIGVIGAGSTDANSFGLIGSNDVITATLNIILGKQIKIDVCSIHSLDEDRVLRFVSTFAAYGYFGDVVRESEKLRWLGPTRYDVTGVNNLLKNRTYKGMVRILVAKQDGSPLDLNRCHSACQQCQLSIEQRRPLEELELSLLEKKGSFVGVNAAVTACRCPQTSKGFSPGNHLANGCADLILVRPCTRLQYLKYLIRTGWTKKSAFDLKYVEAYRCRQFEFVAGSRSDLTPTPPPASSCSDEGKGSSIDSSASSIAAEGATSLASSWNVDGEVLDVQSIRVKVNNQLLRVFGTGELSTTR